MQLIMEGAGGVGLRECRKMLESLGPRLRSRNLPGKGVIYGFQSALRVEAAVVGVDGWGKGQRKLFQHRNPPTPSLGHESSRCFDTITTHSCLRKGSKKAKSLEVLDHFPSVAAGG